MSKLTGKTAVVTGASKGIGASIAEHLAAEGASVVVNYASSKTGADAVVERIKSKGGKAIAVQGDVSKSDDIAKLFAETKKAYGKLDILINNAGVYEFAPLADITPEHFHKQFNLNVLGLLLTTQEAVKLIGADGGSIVNVSSIVGPMPVPTASVYSASKAAVDAITVSLAGELGSHEKDPSQLDQPGHGGDGWIARGWLCGERFPQTHRGDYATGANRTAGRYRNGGGFLCFRRRRMGDRTDAGAGWRRATVIVVWATWGVAAIAGNRGDCPHECSGASHLLSRESPGAPERCALPS